MIPIGLLSWITIGLLVAALVRLWTPGSEPPPRSQRVSPKARIHMAIFLAWGVLGAVLGGLLSTLLGFGGFGVLDPRSLVCATLVACLTAMLSSWRRILGSQRQRPRSQRRS